MKKVKLGLLCLLAGALVLSCKKEEKPVDPNNPGGGGGSTTGSEYVESGGGLSLNLAMVKVEGGTFDMGATSEQGSDAYDDEKPVHKVTLSSYHISKYEVTQAQWKAVMGTSPSYFKGDNLPVESVSWNDAVAFCTKLSEKTGKKYALPTEAQWEFAARGGVKSKGYKYSGSNDLGTVSWYYENSIDHYGDHSTHAVGTKAPNELGIYDMSGNVWEWCASRYGSYSSDAITDPAGPNSGDCRVLRGGRWGYDGGCCRVSYRCHYSPDRYNDDIGFRVVCLP